MQGENLERWQKLCQQAAVEQDSETLFKLIQEITALLDEKQQRLHKRKTVNLPNQRSDGHPA